MSAGPLPLIPEGVLHFAVQPPEFVALVARELGPAEAELGPLEQQEQELLATLPATAADVAGAAPELAEMEAAFPALQEDEAPPILQEIVGAIQEGEPDLGDFERELLPAPPSDGGGGAPGNGAPGGGGGGGGGGPTPPNNPPSRIVFINVCTRGQLGELICQEIPIEVPLPQPLQE